jgi:HPr kinase/phosphorylase
VDVYGIGVLMLGKSGIGKSEVSLELIKRGHRLITDDLIEVIKLNESEILGRGVSMVQHHMEIRGIGIIDVKTLFGIGAIKDELKVDLVLGLEEWDREKEYERLGLEDKYESILGVKIPKLILPVKPGRNLSVIIEAAAMTHRLKAHGYNPAKELNKTMNEWMQKGGRNV